MKEVNIEKCNFCGGEELIECRVGTSQGFVCASTSVFRYSELYVIVCRDCGSVVRTFCKTPEKLYSKKERKA